MFEAIYKKFSNGVEVINSTPHPLNFLDGDEVIVVPTSVPAGERTGFGVINARPTTQTVGDHLVKTVFVPSPEGEEIIRAMREEFPNAFIVGSLAAANAYKEVVGMVPAPGFERVPPDQKRMSIETFNVGEAW